MVLPTRKERVLTSSSINQDSGKVVQTMSLMDDVISLILIMHHRLLKWTLVRGAFLAAPFVVYAPPFNEMKPPEALVGNWCNNTQSIPS